MSHLAFLLGLLIISFLVHSLFFVPYINLLYRIKFQRLEQRTKDAFGKLTPIFDRFHKKKAGVPVGGGLLIILITLALYGVSFLTLYYLKEWYPITSLYPELIEEIKIVLFTFIAFAIIGFYDDFRKTFLPKNLVAVKIRIYSLSISEDSSLFLTAIWTSS